MCGIFCILSDSREQHDLKELYMKEFCFPLLNRGPDGNGIEHFQVDNVNLLFASSLLWLQGVDRTPQPLMSVRSVFVYNGDIFGDHMPEEERKKNGDTQLLYKLLEQAGDVHSALRPLDGPYAFIFLNVAQKRLYFCRDVFGRRSLLIGKNPNNNEIIICSRAKKNIGFDFMEVPALGTFYYDLTTGDWHLHPWKMRNENFTTKLQELSAFLKKDIHTFDIYIFPRRGYVPPTEKDLKFIEDMKLYSPKYIFSGLLQCPRWLQKIDTLKQLLETAVQKRVSVDPGRCKKCVNPCKHAIVGVLFSGGVDCAILALLAHRFIDLKHPIDLINVAFDTKTKNFRTPDRVTSHETLRELRRLAPNRQWNLLEIDVTANSLQFHRGATIKHAIYPLNTILDESLGCALWFAGEASTPAYRSPCRVLLAGMGADELFGGYTKHRIALEKDGWAGLYSVLNEDWQNLPYRNLARDDRVIADHGRQLRTPYLDEDVVRHVRSMHCWERTWPMSDLEGVGEKILLRSLAYDLGLREAATLKKRALQFGCRIANSRENAHEVSPRL